MQALAPMFAGLKMGRAGTPGWFGVSDLVPETWWTVFSSQGSSWLGVSLAEAGKVGGDSGVQEPARKGGGKGS